MKQKAKKIHRKSDNVYLTISLTLDKNIIDFIETQIKNTNQTMSGFIEENTNIINIDVPIKRQYNTNPIKKTFTFTENFVKKIKKSGNMSLFVEKSLINKFNLS